MTDDILLKKIEGLIETQVRPVKDLVEIMTSKLRQAEIFQSVAAEQSRTIRDQVSVMNKKLDEHTKILEQHTVILEKHINIIENQLLPSVITIEDTIQSYGDMYKINGDNILRHEQRLAIVEDKLEITPNPDLKHVDYRNQT